MDHLVVPEKGDARNLPFVDGFFDAILCIDSYIYFGTDDHFLNHILKFLTTGGTLAVAMPGLMKDFEDGVPQHLNPWPQDTAILKQDAGEYVGFIRLAARKR